MPPKKGGGEGSKKAAGQARKADAAAAKDREKAAKAEAAEAADWERGAKDNSKKADAEAKKAEAARKKAEKDALLAEDEKNTPGRAQPKNAKSAAKKPSRSIESALAGLDLNDDDNKKLPELAARNIDDAFDALADVESGGMKIDRHPERRAEALYKAFKEKRMTEMREEGVKLKLSQRTELINREWRKHPDNPNSANYSKPKLAYNSTKEEIAEFKKAEQERVEAKLTVR